MDKLTPDDSILIAGAGGTASTGIVYETDGDTLAIWHRIGKPGGLSKWVKDALETDEDGRELAGGRVGTPGLQAGESIEYAMLASKKFDPNATDFRESLIKATTVVICVLKESTGESWYSDHTTEVGGTFTTIRFFANRPVSLIVQFGTVPPVLSKGAFPVYPGEVVTAGSANFVMAHSAPDDITVQPLDPGHTYFWSVVMVDKNGDWQAMVFPQTIKTKLRRIVIDTKSVTAVDDGDADFIWDNTSVFTAQFLFKKNGQPVKALNFNNNAFNDKDPPVGFANTVVLGPAPGAFDDSFSISASGHDEDGETGVGEFLLPQNNIAGLPFGRKEEVNINSRELMAAPISGSVAFNLNFDVTVNYI